MREHHLVGLVADPDAGVVHHHIHSAIRAAGLIDQGPDCRRVADIDRRGRGGIGSLPGQVPGSAFGAVTADAGNYDHVAPG
jgi:hypothetical protein